MKRKPKPLAKKPQRPAKVTVLKDIDTGWVALPSGGKMRLKIQQMEW